MQHLTTLLLSLFITIALIPIMTKLAARFHMVDFPNPRKVHVRPIPRIGGVAMAAGAFVPIILWSMADDFIIAFVLGASVICIFGFIDDMRDLSYKMKFLAQIIGATIVIAYGDVRIASLGGLLPDGIILPDWFSIGLTLIAIIGVINAINLADGLDGLAGGICLLSFCAIGYLAYIMDDQEVLLICLSLAGAIFGFLRFNTHPASLFMGDTGSQFLGFSAIVLALKITQNDSALSPVLPLIILGFPVLDTLTVMIQRISEGRSPFSPDKTHFHHRLLRFGLFHSEAVFVIYIIQALMVIAAISLKYYSDWFLLVGYLGFAAAIIIAFAAGDSKAFQLTRSKLLDHSIKGRLKFIKDEQWIIRISFNITKYLVPQLFLITVLFPVKIPVYFSVTALCFCLFMVLAWIFRKNYLTWMVRVVLYLTIPLVIYLGEQEKAAWIGRHMEILFYMLFAAGIFFVIMTVKYSRRKRGFQATTMDFLIIFIAIIVPNLPDPAIQSQHLGFLAVEIIVLFFSYEVMITELREKLNLLVTPTIITLLIIGVRGITGF